MYRHNVNCSTGPSALSLFAGAGGCSLGFAKAGFRIVYASDIDRDAVSTYKANFPETPCEEKDVRALDTTSLMLRLGLRPGQLDVLIGGPPCQGFSSAGGRTADDPRNKLLRRYVEVLDALKPKWFLMENVEGLLTAAGGNYVFDAIQSFASLGYFIRLEKVYAQEYGIPQRRKRTIIIGNRLGIDFRFPTPETNVSGRIFRQSDITLMYAIGDLPMPVTEKGRPVDYIDPPQNPMQAFFRLNSKCLTDHCSPSLSEDLARRIGALGIGQTMKDLPEEFHHRSFKQRANRRVMDGTPSEKRGGAPTGLKRLSPDEPCLTITGAATREFIHPYQNRPLTLRECARLQTFPDCFEFHGTTMSKISQIGNAIPPLLANRFAEHILALGFEGRRENAVGRLLGFSLTKASAMSPALERTNRMLESLAYPGDKIQNSLF